MPRGVGEVLKQVFFKQDKRELGRCGQELTKSYQTDALYVRTATSTSNRSALPQGPGSDCNRSWGYRGGTELNKAKARLRADWDQRCFPVPRWVRGLLSPSPGPDPSSLLQP